MRMLFTQSARRHRIAKGRALYVIRHTEPIALTDEDGNITELHWLGDDDRGLELDIVGTIKTDERSTTGEQIILIKHVFPTALHTKGD